MSKAQDHAIKLLRHRARSVAELRRRLEAKGFAAEEVDAALSRLVELRYLDDQSLAESRAQTLVQTERKGPLLAVHRLEAAGIDPARAEAAVEGAKGGQTELQLAREALGRRRPAVGPDAARAERVKAARWLAGRGFSEETVRELLRLDDE